MHLSSLNRRALLQAHSLPRMGAFSFVTALVSHFPPILNSGSRSLLLRCHGVTAAGSFYGVQLHKNPMQSEASLTSEASPPSVHTSHL